jgi:2-polyprenyl-6-methoxyphenol hydroxylase-like FAD-dependent oxidoreductase
MARRALIVGAGIGGLSAATALRKAGWDVHIFERAASPRELGFGVGLAPNAMAALGELGVGETVLARGFEPSLGEMRRLDGTVLKRAAIPRGILGGPFVVSMRPALYGALLDAVGVDRVTAGSDATGFTINGPRVTLHLAGGTSAEGDLLVGADGVRSVIRRQLHPSEPPPRSSRIVSVRGGVDGALSHLGGVDAVYYMGPGVESAFIRASATGIYWFLAYAEELLPAELIRPTMDTSNPGRAGAVVDHVATRFDATFRAITAATTELRFDNVLVDRDPLPSWGTGVVTLIGDAAHPMLPHTGQGAAQAIVDGVTLGKVLAPDVDIEQALRAFEAERRPKTAALVGQGRRTARLMRLQNPLACAAREMLLRVVPVKSMMKFYTKVNRRAGTSVRSGRSA